MRICLIMLALLTAMTATATAQSTPNTAPECSFNDTMAQIIAAPNRQIQYSVRSGGSVAFGFTCKDADGDDWTGSVGGAAGTITGITKTPSARPGQADYDATYAPPAGFTGADKLTVTIDDGHGGVTTGTITFNVTAAGSGTPPRCNSYGNGAQGPRPGERWVLEITCLDSEFDEPTLRVGDIQNAKYIAIAESNRFSNATTFALAIEGGTPGPGQVTIVPSDPSGDGTPWTMFFTVQDPSYNHAPTCSATPDVTVDPGASVPITPTYHLCFDDDRDDVATKIIWQPAHGKLAQQLYLNEPVWVYTAGDKPGQDAVRLAFDDGHGGVVSRTIVITISDTATSVNSVIGDAPALITNQTVSAFRFRSPGHPKATFGCRTYRFPADPPDFEPCTSPYTTGKLREGSYVFEVVATDGLLADPTPAKWSFTLDVTAPDMPTFHELRDQTVEDVTAEGLAVGVDCTGCTARVLVRHGGDVVGQRTVKRSKIATVRVPLDRKLRRLSRVALQVKTTVTDRAGNTRHASYRVVLRHA